MAKRPAQRSAKGSPRVSLARFRELEQAVERNTADLALQFRRIAQIQVELDTAKNALAALKSSRR